MSSSLQHLLTAVSMCCSYLLDTKTQRTESDMSAVKDASADLSGLGTVDVREYVVDRV